MMLISAMIASNLPMTTVFAAAKKQQVKTRKRKKARSLFINQ